VTYEDLDSRIAAWPAAGASQQNVRRSGRVRRRPGGRRLSFAFTRRTPGIRYVHCVSDGGDPQRLLPALPPGWPFRGVPGQALGASGWSRSTVR